jgi:hypothetical protein
MGRDYDTRTPASGTDDGTTTHRIGVEREDDIGLGTSNIRTQHIVQVGGALQWLQASTITGGGVTGLGFYPNDATSISSAGATAAAGSTSSLTMATGFPDWDITGWSVMILSGSAIGDVRRIKAFSSGVITPDRNFTASVAGASYTIGLDTWRRSNIVVKAECQGNSTASPSISVVPVFFDYPRDPKTSGTDQGRLGIDGVARAPRIAFGAQLDMDNYNVQANTVTASYYQMRIRSDVCLGAQLAKIYLLTAPGSSNKCTLYLAAV